MSLYTYINETYVGDAATWKGWEDFCAWADTLDLEKYRQIVHLAEHGMSQEPATLLKQFNDAIRDDPPTLVGVDAIVAGLAKSIKKFGKEAYVVIINDGEGDADEEEDE